MNIIAGFVGLSMLIGLVIAAADMQGQEDKRLTKRFYGEYQDLKEKDEV